MVKHLLNKKGFTLIEMILVLFITSIMALITLFYKADSSNLKYRSLIELLQTAQIESIANHQKITIEIYGSELYINDDEYDLSPLVCDSQYFHFNQKGNISNALTIRCHGKKDYEIRMQLGTGWMSYEK